MDRTVQNSATFVCAGHFSTSMGSQIDVWCRHNSRKFIAILVTQNVTHAADSTVRLELPSKTNLRQMSSEWPTLTRRPTEVARNGRSRAKLHAHITPWSRILERNRRRSTTEKNSRPLWNQMVHYFAYKSCQWILPRDTRSGIFATGFPFVINKGGFPFKNVTTSFIIERMIYAFSHM